VISVDEARRRILDGLTTLPAEQVGLAEAHGRVLAQDVAARRTQPPSAVSAMDGYAVRAADVAQVPVTLTVVAHVPAGTSYEGTLGLNESVRIFTGAPLPAGADTIVIQEDTDGGGETVEVRAGAEAGTYVRPAGLDFSAGATLLDAGRLLTARDIGLAAAMNVPWLSVRRRPRVALLLTGDEIVLPGEDVGPNQIVSSNGFALAGLVAASGGVPVQLGVALDDADSLRVAAERARGCDALVTTGGASIGEHDLLQQALADVGLEIDFWRIAMRPGKPLMYGHFQGIPMLGLPGNPVSSMVCGLLFLRPMLRRMLGTHEDGVPRGTALLGEALGQNDRREDYLRATLERNDAGEAVATAFARQDSSMFATLAAADCLIVRPPHAPPAEAGTRVDIVHLGADAGL